jgi:ubiquinol-cytochrome c reductase cytochrome b subunit
MGPLFFFIFFYFYIFFKGLYFFRHRLKNVWLLGLLIFVLIIIESFLGYVLVWAQISFWAAVVITRLFSVIPFYGLSFVFWLWGGFFVSRFTLKFFFALHFILPWFIFILIILHLLILHNTGRTSKLLHNSSISKINFYPFFWYKDFYNVFLLFLFLLLLLQFPFYLGDREIFLSADYTSSPVHIVPEWYFLFAYAILRSIPNKVLGVCILASRILIFFIFTFLNFYESPLNKISKNFTRAFLLRSVYLRWLGQCLVETPYIF